MSYQVEIAKSNRALCRETSCKQRIGAGELKIGIQGSDWYSWYHACCAWKTFDNRYIKNPRITSTSDFTNFDSVSPEHQAVLLSLIDGTYVAAPVERVARPRRGANAEASVVPNEVASDEIVSNKKRKSRE